MVERRLPLNVSYGSGSATGISSSSLDSGTFMCAMCVWCVVIEGGERPGESDVTIAGVGEGDKNWLHHEGIVIGSAALFGYCAANGETERRS